MYHTSLMGHNMYQLCGFGQNHYYAIYCENVKSDLHPAQKREKIQRYNFSLSFWHCINKEWKEKNVAFKKLLNVCWHCFCYECSLVQNQIRYAIRHYEYLKSRFVFVIRFEGRVKCCHKYERLLNIYGKKLEDNFTEFICFELAFSNKC